MIKNNESKDIFVNARSHNDWLNKDVPDQLLYELYDLMKWGPTSANCSPARIIFIKSKEAKKRLSNFLIESNLEKTMAAPVNAIIAYDKEFYEFIPKLFPHNPEAKEWFSWSEEFAETTAFRNSSLQGAYLMVVARALGLDCGPMSGFNNELVDEQFFSGTNIKSNFLCCLGYGDPSKIFMRLPRFEFDEVCKII